MKPTAKPNARWPGTTAARANPGAPPSGKRDWIFGLVLVLAVIVAYQPVWHAGFIWDDDAYLSGNLCIIGPLGLKEIWTTSAARICPLVLTTFWVEHALWGLRPLLYHLVNVLLQAADAVVLWRVLRRLGTRGAWLGAALWALHPVQVESVAWITELKNTQSCLFYLLAIFFFVKWLATRGNKERNPGHWNYLLALFCGALAMASKSSTVILPVVLGLCAWWMEGRWKRRNLADLTPFLLISVVMSGVSLWTQHLEGANDPEWVRSWPERFVVAGRVVWFYLGKLLWPQPLIFIYPRWEVDASQAASYLLTLAVGMVLFVLWWNRRGRCRPVFFALAYFLAALFPVLGVVDHYFLRYSFVGDHFQYLASMGPLALAAAGIVWLADFLKRSMPWLKAAMCAGLLLALGTLSWHQAGAYRSIETLWTDTLQKNPNCWLAHNNLGNALLQKGWVDEAIVHFQKALQIKPDDAKAHNNLGYALLQKGNVDEAIAFYQKALQIKPNYAEAHYNLGIALLQKGSVDEAIIHFQMALEIKPDYAEANNNLGGALLQKGSVDEAIAHFQKALQIKPGFAEANNNLGGALLQKGSVDEAIAHFQKALQIKPNYAEAHYNLGIALLQKGSVDEAITHYQRALQIKPDYVDAHNNLGNALLQKGSVDEAITQFQTALQIKPDSMDVLNNLAWLLATCPDAHIRDGVQAVKYAERACELTHYGVTLSVGTLAAADAEAGRFDDAIATAQRACDLAAKNGETNLLQKNQELLVLYHNHQPYRDRQAGTRK